MEKSFEPQTTNSAANENTSATNAAIFTNEELRRLYIRLSQFQLTKEQQNLVEFDGYKKNKTVFDRFLQIFEPEKYLTEYTVNLTLDAETISVKCCYHVLIL